MSAYQDLTAKQQEAVLYMRDQGFATAEEAPFTAQTMSALLEKGWITAEVKHDESGAEYTVYGDASRTKDAVYDVDATATYDERYQVRALDPNDAKEAIKRGEFDTVAQVPGGPKRLTFNTISEQQR